jgi:hypothetical protein
MIVSILPDHFARARCHTPARAARFFLAIALLLIAGPPPAAAVTVCYDQAEQAKLVATQDIIPVSTAAMARKAQKKGKFVEAEVCQNQKGFFYKMTMQSDAGETEVVRVRATPPQGHPELHLKRNCYYTGRSWATGSICRLECTGDACPRQYCKASGEWQALASCQGSSTCQNYRSC